MARLAHEIPYVEARGPDGGAPYRYRRIVPPEVRGHVKNRDGKPGRKVWVKSFRRNTPVAVIEREAARLAREHDLIVARVRGQPTDEAIAEAEANARRWLDGDKAKLHEMLASYATMFDGLSGADLSPQVQAFLSAIENKGTYVPAGLTVSAARKKDREQHGDGEEDKAGEWAVSSFIAHAGDADIFTIKRADVTGWLAASKGEGLAPSTIVRRLGALRALVNRTFADREYGGANPFAGHKIKGGAGSAGDVLPFSKAMLARIGAYVASSSRLRPETRNILQLMKGTGGGDAEVGGLALSDVNLGAEVPYVWIRANDLRGLKVKAESEGKNPRDRRVPLVGDALAAAQDAVKRAKVRAKGMDPDKVPLFTGFKVDGRGADSISAKLNNAIRAAGVPKSRRLVAYSFRHTMKEALRSAGIADHVQRRLLGHAGEGVADRYGSPATRLREARDALALAMAHLGDVDDAIYNTAERMKG